MIYLFLSNLNKVWIWNLCFNLIYSPKRLHFHDIVRKRLYRGGLLQLIDKYDGNSFFLLSFLFSYLSFIHSMFLLSFYLSFSLSFFTSYFPSLSFSLSLFFSSLSLPLLTISYFLPSFRIIDTKNYSWNSLMVCESFNIPICRGFLANLSIFFCVVDIYRRS